MVDPALISIISASTALVASVTGPLVTLYVSRSQIKAAVRSANRQKWIDEFRELIARFCAQVAAATQVREQVFKDGRVSISAGSSVLDHFEHLIFTATKIRLMVNPTELEHQKLIEVVEALLTRFRTAPADDDLQSESQATARQIIAISLTIIRQEWLRVQRAA